MTRTFSDTLHAPGPARDRADKLSLYGWLIGDWILEGEVHRDTGEVHHGEGEVHFGWVLEGRAIQDVWILPGVFYGTTLRVYDPGLDAWHIVWSDPLRQIYVRQIGRAEGPDIVQLGEAANGVPLRWRFTDITSDSFRWIGERSPDGSASWQVQAEFRLRRADTA